MRASRPSSDLVVRGKGERMHQMRDKSFSVRVGHRLHVLWLECHACDRGPLSWHQFTEV